MAHARSLRRDLPGPERGTTTPNLSHQAMIAHLPRACTSKD